MKGSCLCQAVAIIIPDRSAVEVCHCGMCRQWGGGPFFAVQCDGAVTIEGEEQVARFRSSEWAERGFCRRCGTHLFYHALQGDSYAVPAGLFDEAEFALDYQIFIDSKPDYYALANQTPTMTGAEAMAHFAAGSAEG